MTPFDPVQGEPTPDEPNAGRIGFNAMQTELESRLGAAQVGDPGFPRGYMEMQSDVGSFQTTFKDSGLQFPVLVGELSHFFALILWAPAVALDWNEPGGTTDRDTGIKFSVLGPGATPSPVDWLHYVVDMPHNETGTIDIRAYSQYDSGSAGTSAPIGAVGSVGDRVAVMRGFITPPSSGLLRVRFGSQSTIGGTRVCAGSTLEWW